MSFGAEAADRRIIVVCRWQRGNSPGTVIVQVRVNGVVATIDADYHSSPLGGGGSTVEQAQIAIASVALPTGTSGPVAMQTNYGVTGTVHLYRVTGLASGTPVDFSEVGTTGAVCSSTIDVEAGGVLIVATTSYRPSAGGTVVGSTTVYGAYENATNYYSEDGTHQVLGDETGRTISLDLGGSAAAYKRTIMVAASYL